MDIETLKPEQGGGEFEQRLNLMDVPVKLLSIAGIIPSKEICSSLWKYRLYRLCQMSSYILYITVLALQVLGLYHYWADMVITTDNIAVTGTLMIGYIPTIFAITNSADICDLIDYLETSSILSFRKIRSNRKYMKTIQEAKILMSYVTWFAIVSLLITIFFWTVYPLVLLILKSETEGTQNHEDLRTTFQYFVFVMLIPSDLSDSYVYGVIYVVQAITFSTALTYLIGLIPLYLSLIVYTTAQFKIVSEAMNEVDNSQSYEQENEMLADFMEENAERAGKISLLLQPRVMSCDGQCKCEVKLWREAAQRNDLQSGTSKQRHPNPSPISSSGASTYNTTNNVEADPTIFMMVECIKLHQSAIRFAHAVNDVLGQCLLFSCLCVTVLLVTQTFQNSMFLSTRYVTGFLTSLTQLCVLSWFGQGIIDQSLAVGQTAYNCLWYERSADFKHLLLTVLVRAQKPLHITLGKIMPLSIQLLALILNISYKFYTVLLNLHES